MLKTSNLKQSDKPIKRLVLSRRFGERLKIGDAWVTIEYKGSNTVKVTVDAPEEVIITREEIYASV